MIFHQLCRRERNIIGNDNCLIYALRQCQVDKKKLNHMRSTIKCNSFPLSKIAQEYDISMEVFNEKDMRISSF
jgi:hypothetical protein